MKLLFAASEAVPYYKTGGLADVARALPDALHERGLDVRIILPAYRTVASVPGSIEHEADLVVPWPDAPLAARCRLHRPGAALAPAVLVEQPAFFDTAQPYAESPDPRAVARRFAFFSRAVVTYAARWGADVVHLNDWQTGLATAVGVAGVGLGWWWFDGAAAIFVGASILYDGIRNMVTAITDLADARARTIEGNREHPVIYQSEDHANSNQNLLSSPHRPPRIL